MTREVKSQEDLRELLKCPVCKSEDIEVHKQGFKGGRAALANAFLGPAGILAGEYGKDNLECQCKDCDHKWKIKFE